MNQTAHPPGCVCTHVLSSQALALVLLDPHNSIHEVTFFEKEEKIRDLEDESFETAREKMRSGGHLSAGKDVTVAELCPVCVSRVICDLFMFSSLDHFRDNIFCRCFFVVVFSGWFVLEPSIHPRLYCLLLLFTF